jgi:SAM-dependent methyltransferase
VTVARDGSPVDLYLRLPPRGEAELVHDAIPAGAEILELGCGVGRVTHELLRLGHPVVAVDEAPEMLQHVSGATTVCARIEELELGRRFPCVLLMSNLVNTDPAERAGFLAACARHVARDGLVVIERHEPGWDPEDGSGGQVGNLTVSLEDVRRENGTVSATVRYEAADATWRHAFTAYILDDAALNASLADAGLELTAVLDDAGRWVAAGPIIRDIVAA